MVVDVAGTRGIQRIGLTLQGKSGNFTVIVVKRVAYLGGDVFRAARLPRLHGCAGGCLPRPLDIRGAGERRVPGSRGVGDPAVVPPRHLSDRPAGPRLTRSGSAAGTSGCTSR